MKKRIIVFVLVLLTVALCACGRRADSSDAGNNNNGTSQANNTAASSNDKDYKVDQVFFRTFQGTDGVHFQASMRVTNTGKTPLFLYNASWDLKDSSGKAITNAAGQPAMMAYPQVLYEGETSWYYINTLAEKMTDGSGDIATAEPKYRITDPPENHIAFFKRYQVSELRLEENGGKLTASGMVENNTDEGSNYILIYVNLYDKDGRLVGQLKSSATPLLPGEKQSFVAEQDSTWSSGELSLALSDIASYDAVAYYLKTA